MYCIDIILYLSDFYGKGPLRDDDGMCIPHEPNDKERGILGILVIFCFLGSLLVAGISLLDVFLWKWGIVSDPKYVHVCANVCVYFMHSCIYIRTCTTEFSPGFEAMILQKNLFN